MPAEIKELKDFVELFKENAKAAPEKKPEAAQDPKAAGSAALKKKFVPKNAYKKRLFIKTTNKITKFKLRTSRRLYTFQTDNKEIAKKILNSVPSTIVTQEIKKKKKVTKK